MIAIVQFIVTIVILTILYKNMIKRENPSIEKAQAVVPVVLGIVSLIVSVLLTLCLAFVLMKLAWNRNNISNLAFRSLASSFLSAGLPEEIGKCIFILICITIFKPKNVYEYLLTGFGVGMGFTIFEEFLYGSNLVAVVVRMIILTFHAVLGSIMASHIGMAKYYKMHNVKNKNITAIYVKALLIPIIIHTIYDATNIKNAGLEEGVSDVAQAFAVIVALVTLLIAFILQIMVHIKIKNETNKLIDMEV